MISQSVECFNEIHGENIRNRLSVKINKEKYLNDKIEYVLNSKAVNHPFLDFYQKNKLSRKEEIILFSECFYWFKDLPFYISGMSSITRDTNILKEISINVLDEVGGEKSHAELYVDFLNDLGINESDVINYTPSKEVIKLNKGMEELYGGHPILKALGALFFDEAMSTVMMYKMNKALKFNGYSSDIRFFWEIHIELEKSHSNGMFNAIHPYIDSDYSKKVFESGIIELENLVEMFWNNIEKMILLKR